MDKVKLVYADDSAVLRRILSEAFAQCPELEVIGVGKHGGEAVELVGQLQPDVVVLDVEMPVLDGVEAVVEIRKRFSKLPIVMFSSITTRGGEATLDALYAGANDYVTKPARVGHLNEAMELVRFGLIPRVLEWGRRFRNAPVLAPEKKSAQSPATARRAAPNTLSPPASQSPTTKKPAQAERPESLDAVKVIAIGVSTGGPNALADLTRELPANLGVPIVITQHMPPTYTKLLAERLDKSCPLTVVEGEHGARLEPGTIWIAPGGRHMSVVRKGADYFIDINDLPPENSCRPAVDVLFRGVANAYGSGVLAVVLTGMGKDGLEGCREIRAKRGRVFVQDQATSVVWGMPRAVYEAGLAHKILPLNEIARELTLATQGGKRAAQPIGA